MSFEDNKFFSIIFSRAHWVHKPELNINYKTSFSSNIFHSSVVRLKFVHNQPDHYCRFFPGWNDVGQEVYCLHPAVYTLLWPLLPCEAWQTADLSWQLLGGQGSQVSSPPPATPPRQPQKKDCGQMPLEFLSQRRWAPFCLGQPQLGDWGPAGSHCGWSWGRRRCCCQPFPDADLLGPDFIGCHHQEDCPGEYGPKYHE